MILHDPESGRQCDLAKVKAERSRYIEVGIGVVNDMEAP